MCLVSVLFVGLFSFETQVRENVSAVFIQPFLEGFTEVPISLLITVTNDTRDILIGISLSCMFLLARDVCLILDLFFSIVCYAHTCIHVCITFFLYTLR